jgi:hypothetical protein
MSTNETPPRTDHMINRIQQVSVYLRSIFLGCAVVFGLISLLGFAANATEKHQSLSFYLNVSSLGRAVECWFGYKLFSSYVRGELFVPEAIRYMRWIGIASLLLGGGNIINTLYARLHDGFFQHVYDSPFVVRIVVYLQLICSQLVFNLVFGLVIILIAWIMDEGRKIQEEQALTV